MLTIDESGWTLHGEDGCIKIPENDKALLKFCMLYEGQCLGLGPTIAADKYGYSRQRYHQILKEFIENGLTALIDKKTGPKSNYRKTEEVTRQIIRCRFLDNDVSPDVIAQRLKQMNFPISIRSVEEVITEFGLQKKTPYKPTQTPSASD